MILSITKQYGSELIQSFCIMVSLEKKQGNMNLVW